VKFLPHYTVIFQLYKNSNQMLTTLACEKKKYTPTSYFSLGWY